MVWDYEPHTLPTFYMGHLWAKYYTPGVSMGSGHCRSRMKVIDIHGEYKGSSRLYHLIIHGAMAPIEDILA